MDEEIKERMRAIKAKHKSAFTSFITVLNLISCTLDFNEQVIYADELLRLAEEVKEE